MTKKKNKNRKKGKKDVLISLSYGENGDQFFVKPNDTAKNSL